jgi:hypothetical protein
MATHRSAVLRQKYIYISIDIYQTLKNYTHKGTFGNLNRYTFLYNLLLRKIIFYSSGIVKEAKATIAIFLVKYILHQKIVYSPLA